jgi:hypothetical protein
VSTRAANAWKPLQNPATYWLSSSRVSSLTSIDNPIMRLFYPIQLESIQKETLEKCTGKNTLASLEKTIGKNCKEVITDLSCVYLIFPPEGILISFLKRSKILYMVAQRLYENRQMFKFFK